METKSNHTLVGAFVITSIAIFFGFILWFTKSGSGNTGYKNYHIYFETSVSGLRLGSPVNYRGINIGEVSDIGFDKNDFERVHVTVMINKNIPIKEDMTASITSKGITGVVFIELKGGSNSSAILRPEKNKKIAVIPSTPSNIDAILERFPRIVDNTNQLTERIKNFLSEENEQNVSLILEDIQILLSNFSDHENGIPTLLKNSQELVSDLKISIKEIKQTVTSFKTLSHNVNLILEENKDSLNQFSSETLTELNTISTELKTLIQKSSKTLDDLDQGPANYLLNGSNSGYKVD